MTMKIFAERLKELREERGLSIQAMGRESGVIATSICRWENMKAEIRINQLVKVAKFFNVSTDYLLGLDNYR